MVLLVYSTHPDHSILEAPHNDRPMRRWNDSEGGPKHKSQCLHVGGHVQPRNLQDQTHDKDQSHSGYVEVSERLPRKKGQLLNPVHFSTSSHSRPDTKRRSRSH